MRQEKRCDGDGDGIRYSPGVAALTPDINSLAAKWLDAAALNDYR